MADEIEDENTPEQPKVPKVKTPEEKTKEKKDKDESLMSNVLLLQKRFKRYPDSIEPTDDFTDLDFKAVIYGSNANKKTTLVTEYKVYRIKELQAEIIKKEAEITAPQEE